MNFKDYQKKASTTAVYPKPVSFQTPEESYNACKIVPIMYCALGLAGESGEVAEQVKKSWRNNMKVTDERRTKISDELGDVLWYAAQLATELDLNLDDVAENNIAKLAARKQEGKLKHE
jgi:NTP pyrophosphatase (non-canonical NTP hydrolase)